MYVIVSDRDGVASEAETLEDAKQQASDLLFELIELNEEDAFSCVRVFKIEYEMKVDMEMKLTPPTTKKGK